MQYESSKSQELKVKNLTFKICSLKFTKSVGLKFTKSVGLKFTKSVVVATSDGVEEYKGEEKQPIYDLSEFNDDIDPEMKKFISTHKLNDMQQPLLQSKFTVKHLAGLNSRDDGDA